jgi:hypothetical protein
MNRTFQVKFASLNLKHLVLTPLIDKVFRGIGVKAKTRRESNLHFPLSLFIESTVYLFYYPQALEHDGGGFLIQVRKLA